LVNKKELSKISAQLDKPWMTAVALEVLITDRGFVKIKIWIGRLKKKIEKKQVLKERSQEKEMRKEAKLFG
jgi:SsrA-binding protein